MTRSWEDKDKEGIKHYRTEIVAETVQFGPQQQASAKSTKDAPGEIRLVPEDVPPDPASIPYIS